MIINNFFSKINIIHHEFNSVNIACIWQGMRQQGFKGKFLLVYKAVKEDLLESE